MKTILLSPIFLAFFSLVVTTQKDCGSGSGGCDDVKNLNATNITSSSVTLVWDHNCHQADTWEVCWKRRINPLPVCDANSVTHTWIGGLTVGSEYTITGLTQNKNYKARVYISSPRRRVGTVTFKTLKD